MKSLGYLQNHTLSDIRLGLGYAAVICCAAAAYYEYKVGFKEAKSWSMLGVGAYFLFNAGLYFWGYFIEGNTVYVGSKNGITVSSDPLVSLCFSPFLLVGSYPPFRLHCAIRLVQNAECRWK